jgi:hypothetical protein
LALLEEDELLELEELLDDELLDDELLPELDDELMLLELVELPLSVI